MALGIGHWALDIGHWTLDIGLVAGWLAGGGDFDGINDRDASSAIGGCEHLAIDQSALAAQSVRQLEVGQAYGPIQQLVR